MEKQSKTNTTNFEAFIEIQREWCEKRINSNSASRRESNRYNKLVRAAALETGLTVREIRIIAAYRINPALREIITTNWYKLRNELTSLPLP